MPSNQENSSADTESKPRTRKRRASSPRSKRKKMMINQLTQRSLLHHLIAKMSLVLASNNQTILPLRKNRMRVENKKNDAEGLHDLAIILKTLIVADNHLGDGISQEEVLQITMGTEEVATNLKTTEDVVVAVIEVVQILVETDHHENQKKLKSQEQSKGFLNFTLKDMGLFVMLPKIISHKNMIHLFQVL